MLKAKRVLITGGHGFLGKHLVNAVASYEPTEISTPSRLQFDLRKDEEIRWLFKQCKPHVVIHAAAEVGGIGANKRRPAGFLYSNALMGLQLLDYAKRFAVEKYVLVGTTCSYPAHAQIPFKETAIWNGYPEETNAPYGIAKRLLMEQVAAYQKQYNMNATCVIPANLYGPGDSFDLENGHVIPALIRKFMEAKLSGKQIVPVWGTGEASRDFLFVRDAANGIAKVASQYDSNGPVNLGSGEETTIKELAELIRDLVGFTGDIFWETSRPNGQLRRRLCTKLADQQLGWKATTNLERGLTETIDWYKHHMKKAA